MKNVREGVWFLCGNCFPGLCKRRENRQNSSSRIGGFDEAKTISIDEGGMKLFAIAVALVLFAGPAHADILPKQLLGLWGFEAADCSNPRSDGLLKIEPKTVRFFASSYEIKHVVRRSDGSLRATGIVSHEGEQGRGPGALTLKLIARDSLLALDHAYHRCR